MDEIKGATSWQQAQKKSFGGPAKPAGWIVIDETTGRRLGLDIRYSTQEEAESHIEAEVATLKRRRRDEQERLAAQSARDSDGITVAAATSTVAAAPQRTTNVGVSFARIIMQAREAASMSAAEMDYSLASGTGEAASALRDAAWVLANPRWAVAREDIDVEQAKAVALWQSADGDAELAAMTTRAKAKSYTGWSVQSKGPIRYAR